MDGGGGIALPNAACLTECAKNVFKADFDSLKKIISAFLLRLK